MKYDCKEDIIQLTPLWTGERFDDGRPRVPDEVIEKIRGLSLEEVWKPLWLNGYKSQFEGDLRKLHESSKLVGRAVTAVMGPMRPDLHETLLRYGREVENRKGFFNQWVIETMTEDDVLVVDMFDKVFEGTFVGGNLSTSIHTKTKRGGAVVWGGIRDLEQMLKIPDYQVYYRGIDPTPIANVTMLGMNVPCRIGKALCLPGDIVFGSYGGVMFIPAHLAEKVVISAEKTRLRDIFGFIRLQQKIYTTYEVDTRWWNETVLNDFLQWKETAPEAQPYSYLTWDEEIQKAKEYGDQFTGISL